MYAQTHESLAAGIKISLYKANVPLRKDYNSYPEGGQNQVTSTDVYTTMGSNTCCPPHDIVAPGGVFVQEKLFQVLT